MFRASCHAGQFLVATRCFVSFANRLRALRLLGPFGPSQQVVVVALIARPDGYQRSVCLNLESFGDSEPVSSGVVALESERALVLLELLVQLEPQG